MCGQRLWGESAHVRDTPLGPVSCGAASAPPSGTDVTRADPMRALAPARASRDRERRVPKRETSRCAARRRGSGTWRSVARCAQAEERRFHARRARAMRPRTQTTSVSGAFGVMGGAP